MTRGRDFTDFLHDIVENIQAAEAFLAETDFDAFVQDRQRAYATVRALEVIGEAARHVPASVRRRAPGIPWRRIVAMRNVLAHDYFGVDLEVIWRTVHEDLPSLKANMEQLLNMVSQDHPETAPTEPGIGQ